MITSVKWWHPFSARAGKGDAPSCCAVCQRVEPHSPKGNEISSATKAIGFHQNLSMLLLARLPTSNKQFNSFVKHGT